MIEGTQVAFSLLAACLLARGNYRGSVLGGTAFGLALLTKINVAFLTPVLLLLALPRPGRVSDFRDPNVWARAAVFTGVAVALAATGNLLLYFAEPELYIEAYRFELVGAQFESISNPLVRIGRFGLDPSLIARSLLALIREAPFQIVFCAAGVGAVVFGRLSIHPAYWAWLLWGTGFVLIQNFQPVRYFFLTAPAYCVFAATAIHQLSDTVQGPRWFVWNRVQTGVLVVYAVFNIGYLGMNAVANPDRRLQTIREWVMSNTESSDRIIAASYFSVDLPNRVYGHYHLGGSDIDALAASVEDYQIDYIIYDDGEWRGEARYELESRYVLVKEWPFGAVFRVER